MNRRPRNVTEKSKCVTLCLPAPEGDRNHEKCHLLYTPIRAGTAKTGLGLLAEGLSGSLCVATEELDHEDDEGECAQDTWGCIAANSSRLASQGDQAACEQDGGRDHPRLAVAHDMRRSGVGWPRFVIKNVVVRHGKFLGCQALFQLHTGGGSIWSVGRFPASFRPEPARRLMTLISMS